jgi:predicted DNA-binding ribbon-helix-helix protein
MHTNDRIFFRLLVEINRYLKNEISHMLNVVEEDKKNTVDVLSLLRHSCRRCVGQKSLLPMETPQFYGSAAWRDAEAPVRRHYVKDPQPKKTSA